MARPSPKQARGIGHEHANFLCVLRFPTSQKKYAHNPRPFPGIKALCSSPLCQTLPLPCELPLASTPPPSSIAHLSPCSLSALKTLYLLTQFLPCSPFCTHSFHGTCLFFWPVLLLASVLFTYLAGCLGLLCSPHCRRGGAPAGGSCCC